MRYVYPAVALGVIVTGIIGYISLQPKSPGPRTTCMACGTTLWNDEAARDVLEDRFPDRDYTLTKDPVLSCPSCGSTVDGRYFIMANGTRIGTIETDRSGVIRVQVDQ